jgi:lysophospholipase L1-like esterase
MSEATTASNKPRPWIAALAAIILTLLPVVAIAAIEGAGRVWIWWKHGVPGHSYGIYEAHPVLGGVLARSGYNNGGKVTNGQAFQRRTETPAAPPADRPRVIAYGGSTTFCYNLPTDLDWPQLMERRAEARGARLEVLNAGDINWTVHHALARSKYDIPAFRPDIIVIYEGINEESNFAYLKAAGVDVVAQMNRGDYRAFAPNVPQADWFYRNSLVVKFFGQVLGPAVDNFLMIGAAKVEQETHIEMIPEVARFYRGIVATAIDEWRAAGIRVVYVVQAHGENAPRSFRLTAYSRDAAETARQHGALVVDSQAVVGAYKAQGGKPMDLFITSGVHWSEKGSRLLAEFLYDEIEKAGGWKVPRLGKN